MTYTSKLVATEEYKDLISTSNSYYSVVRVNVDLSVIELVRRLVSFKVYSVVHVEIKRSVVRDSL